ncbi:MAG: O-antigen ligase family protein [Actinobacteria bacterium]|nr:O-antigen ligase family protein [Actinomycetota bacterium]
MSEHTSASRYWVPAYVLCGVVAATAGYYVVDRKPLLIVAGVALGLLALAASFRLEGSQGLFIALLSIFAFTIPMSGVRVSQTTALSDVIMLPLIALVFLMTVRTKDTVVPEMKPLMIGGALISACGVASSFTAADVTLALFGAFRVFVATVLLPWAIGTIRLTTPLARLMTWAWMAGLVISCVLGFVHFKTPFGRVLGLTTHENHFGLTAVFGVGVALALYLSEKGFLRYVAFGCLAITAYGVIESGSRASLLGMVLAAGIFVLRTRRSIFLLWGWLAIVVSFAVLVTGIVQLPEYNALARLFGGGNASVEIADDVRAEAHEWAVEKIDRNPLFGGGFDEAEIVHNVYLQIWASAGLLALASFLLVMVAAARPAIAPKVLHPDASQPWDRRALLSLGYSVGCIGYFLIATTSNIFWTRYVWFQMAMAIALSSRRYADVPLPRRAQSTGGEWPTTETALAAASWPITETTRQNSSAPMSSSQKSSALVSSAQSEPALVRAGQPPTP